MLDDSQGIDEMMHTGEDDVQHVLDGVRNEVSTTASKTGALEYVNNVVPKIPISIGQLTVQERTYIMMFMPDS